MMLVLSGEGPSDLGQCQHANGMCSGTDFMLGPLTVMLDQLLEVFLGYRPVELDRGCVCFVPKAELLRRQNERKQGRRVSLVGKKRDQETGHFFHNAWTLGCIALEQESARNDRGIAVLHRDSDPTTSSKSAEWASKFKSMHDGFLRAGYDRGVAMLPKPISEAWLLCASRNGAVNCAALEEESGNPSAANPLKNQLAEALGEEKSAAGLSEWLNSVVFDKDRALSMPSFARFYETLQDAITKAM